MKLVGDVGGTKTLLALVDDAGCIVRKRRLASVDFSDFDDLLTEYLRGISGPVNGGCLAVAGPVADDGCSAKITNRPWVIDTARIEARCGVGRIALINDFAAVALGVAATPEEQLVTVQPGVPAAGGLRLVLGAGTGMGVAALLGEQVLPSEGGHIGFSPQDASQAQIHAALLAEHGRVIVEHVVSGPGLSAIHRILTGISLSPEEVGSNALAGEPTALATTDVFFACYGAFAGDMALAFMPTGGVYLAGGVTQALLPLLAGSPFLAAFNAKAGHAAITGRMPVHVVDETDIGLIGAAAFLRFVNNPRPAWCISSRVAKRG